MLLIFPQGTWMIIHTPGQSQITWASRSPPATWRITPSIPVFRLIVAGISIHVFVYIYTHIVYIHIYTYSIYIYILCVCTYIHIYMYIPQSGKSKYFSPPQGVSIFLVARPFMVVTGMALVYDSNNSSRLATGYRFIKSPCH